MLDAVADDPVRWGLLATSSTAQDFVTELAYLPGSCAVAVASHVAAFAERFGRDFGIDRQYASYEALASDPAVDAIFVATPNPGRHDAARIAIEAGKPVLIDTPFAMDAAEADDLASLARSQGTFLMEAMWTRALPHMDRVRAILGAGTLGTLVSLNAAYGQWFPFNDQQRMFKRSLAGGALLNLGIYPVSFASMVLGTPREVTAVSHPSSTGVDAQTSMIFQYASGAHALLNTTIDAPTQNTASIIGTLARIEITAPFYRSTQFHVTDRDEIHIEVYRPDRGGGLRYLAAEVERCIRAGLTESQILPLDETLSIMKTMDEVCTQIGLTY